MDQPREPERTGRQRGQALQRVVDPADRVVAVGDDVVEAEQARRQLPVDREAGRGQRGGPKRPPIRACERCLDPHGVSFERLGGGGQEVAEGGGLGRLGVGVAGHQRLDVLLDPPQEGQAEPLQAGVDVQQLAPQRQAGHRGVQVVAAARQVEVAAGLLACQLHDPRFHLEEEVFDRAGRRRSWPGRPAGPPARRPRRVESAGALIRPVAWSISRWASLASSIGPNSQRWEAANCGARMVSA